MKINKSLLWLSHFLNKDSSKTFMHRTNSALAAGYKAGSSAHAMGNKNNLKYEKEIAKWFDEVGLSEAVLKTKLISLLEAKETKFFADKGIVTDHRDVEALGIQQRALDMAFKIKGSYAPEKVEHSGITVQVVRFCDDENIKENVKK
jgi:hypothetical protein